MRAHSTNQPASHPRMSAGAHVAGSHFHNLWHGHPPSCSHRERCHGTQAPLLIPPCPTPPPPFPTAFPAVGPTTRLPGRSLK
eukprot:350433-Chlamydomonas_euryale.AAC.1